MKFDSYNDAAETCNKKNRWSGCSCWENFREFQAFDTHNQIITDDGATSRDAFQLLAELCAIDVPTLLIRGAQRGASARRPCASREAEGAAADRADWAALWYFLINRIIELYRNRIELSADDLRRVTWKRAIFRHYFSVPSLSCPLRASHSHTLPDPPLRDLHFPRRSIRHPFWRAFTHLLVLSPVYLFVLCTTWSR